MTQIAVTGVSGFVGRHLVPLLLREGQRVRGLARSSPEGTGAAGTIEGFEFIPGDVRDASAVSHLLTGCEAVVHLAASFDRADDGAAINEEGTRTLVAAAKAAGITRLVFLSCQGADAAAPTAFQRSKWKAEVLIRGAGIPYTILRSSLIVGNGDGVVRPLADLILSWPAIPLPGDGQQRQQPIDVDDLCRCLVAALAGDALQDQTVAVGGPTFVTVGQLVDLISGELNVLKPKVHIPYRANSLVARALPVPARFLFLEPRLSQLQHGVVASPGIVERTFDFKPADVIQSLARYLA